MKTSGFVVLGLSLLAGCAGEARETSAKVAAEHGAPMLRGAPGPITATAAEPARDPASARPPTRRRAIFASHPDRGDLMVYVGDVVNTQGAHTWYRVAMSETHALNAIVRGHLRVAAPDGQRLDFQYDRHVEHPSGDWTWIGHLVGGHDRQAVLTFGANAVFGSIGQPGEPPLRILMRDGLSWLVTTDLASAAVSPSVSQSRNDFNADGKSDLLWRNVSNGANVIWLSARWDTTQRTSAVTNLAWNAVGVGDFDGDGKSDIFWRNSFNGANVIWKSGNNATFQSVDWMPTYWVMAGVGDFNADGQSDNVWHYIGNTFVDLSASGPRIRVDYHYDWSWKIAAVADFNGDGTADIVWRHAETGLNSLWLSGDSALEWPLAPLGDLAWNVVGADDFDGDGNSDLLWRNSRTGANLIWRTALSTTPQAITGVFNLDWKVGAVGDYDGDGKADIFWRNSRTGANVIWWSGNSATAQAARSVTNLSWKIQPALLGLE